MELLRGWEGRYAPGNTGGLRLSKAAVYRKLGEEEGVGDKREGELRADMPGWVESTTRESLAGPIDFVLAPEDGPEIEVKNVMPGEKREFRSSLRIKDTELDSPFLLCLSRKPLTTRAWEKLRGALPDRYDTWTVTDNLDALKFEVECGLKRWMALNGISDHRMHCRWGWVDYSYDEFPPAVQPGNLLGSLRLERWFRKGRKYRLQQEYRLAWEIHSNQRNVRCGVFRHRDADLWRPDIDCLIPAG